MKINNLYEIQSPKGFEHFKGIKKTTKSKYVEIILKNSTTLKSSLDHKFIVNGEVIYARDLKVGSFLENKLGVLEEIILVNLIKKKIELFDIIEVQDSHSFYANGILSSNCDADFMSSGNTVFNSEDMTFYEATQILEPMEKRGFEGGLWIWQIPDYAKNYMVVADVARGDSSDYSTFHILDLENAEQVGEFRGKLSPKDFGNLLVGISSEYNDALLVIENANVGWATIEQVLEREYKNLFYSSTSQNETTESYLRKYERDKLTPGFTTSLKTRPLLVAKMMEYVKERSVDIKSKRLLEEMRVFIWKNGKPEASQGYNDDLVMAFAIGLYVRDTALQMLQEGNDLTRAQLNAFGNLNRREATIVTGRTQHGKDSFKMKVGNNNEDFSWVLK
jgi:hypothetical protein